MITLCYSPGSCSLAPHIVLREIGVPFTAKRFAADLRENYSDEYLQINPRGRVPALMIDGFTMTETPAILAYLGRRFPDSELFPSNSLESEARCLERLAWSSNTVHVAYAQIRRAERYVLNPADYATVRDGGHHYFQRCIAEMDEHLQQNRFALGDRYSVVDPFWLVFYRWGCRQSYEMAERFPALTTYVTRLVARPAVQQTLDAEGISIWPNAGRPDRKT
ncbi:glutathione S-transferase family protein [Noviherbaspirillum saxi]|uniref:Glutathione S-transferase n=1 Tax=Noviherbaspirillum saxi TaxID=2320863 RepID=A0A3A3FVD2_9BURK|nr:glutathione S-transferase [Noviherbaspirillum saxi]